MTERELTRETTARALVGWGTGLAVCTLLLWTSRGVLHEAHMVLAYLLVVLGGSARHGRAVGITLAVMAFAAFNYFLLPPLYTLSIEDPLDWWILASFLITAGVAAQLLHRIQQSMYIAQERAREIDRLSSLGAQNLAAPRAEEALHATAHMIAAELGAPLVEIIRFDGPEEGRVVASTSVERSPADPSLVRSSVTEGRIIGVDSNGSPDAAPPGTDLSVFLSTGRQYGTILAPLRVRDRPIGVLRLRDPEGLRLASGTGAFGDTLTHYAALALERTRLTEEARDVAALREADRLKDQLIASVSHDLRTPLTTIRALSAELRTDGDARAAVIEEQAERLNRMVTDLLDLSRIRSGRLALEIELVAAEDLVGAALRSLRGVAGAERVSVSLPPDGELLVGRFDFAQSLRALSNLLDNALRHADGGSVELEVGQDAGSVVFRVMDRGPGVPQSERERIFEPFFRSRAHDGGSSGAGLGLSIARSVAEAQGGSVTCRDREGGGSTFELRLPAVSLNGLP